ncbi:queuosine precursor transporter [Rhodobacter sp. KR11]|uniref:queuosine precursor transporter n=1 Tax=Rhodobacter sp. KR11 TaxID=2974588 RepID=UPI002222FD33|nr:queuosine precursor transporter [Rhodobacter sp. KR11]MCW1918944.1 queuosine precursor transporter [Rhodobacter sp. KR11]
MKTLLPGIIAMAALVVASNILVNHPLGAYLTWGALTYPFCFLVNDVINRLEGKRAARIVVLAGFVVGLACSVVAAQVPGLTTLRIAFASLTAFALGQLLDITIFDRLRRAAWWRAPLVATLFGSTLDSVVFFTLAFAGALSFLEPGNDVSWAGEIGPLLGFGPAVPYWISLGVADWAVKFAIALFGLLPFRLIIAKLAQPVAESF